MTFDPDLAPPEDPGRTAWEAEYLVDPVDDAGRYADVPLLSVPDLDPVEEHRARVAAEAERDYWHDQYLAVLEERERERSREERYRWTGR